MCGKRTRPWMDVDLLWVELTHWLGSMSSRHPRGDNLLANAGDHVLCYINDVSSNNLFVLDSVTHTHTFNGPFSGTTQVSGYQKGKNQSGFFTEARDSELQWHQLGHMQICTSLQTDNHASNPPLSFLQAGCPSCHPTNSLKALKGLLNSVTAVEMLLCCLEFVEVILRGWCDVNYLVSSALHLFISL